MSQRKSFDDWFQFFCGLVPMLGSVFIVLLALWLFLKSIWRAL